jgi:hypothetical protein
MAEETSTSSQGRKAFFLHPSALTQNQIINELAQEEFEVYVIKNELKIKQALEFYPDSILFASINEAMKETAWIELLQGLHDDPLAGKFDLAFISSTNDEEIKKKYTETFDFNCGYVIVKSDIEKAIKQIVTVLNNVNAKGRRKFIRLVTDKGNTKVNLPVNGAFRNGNIKDISVVGFSCVFDEDPNLPKNGFFGDIQLRLQGQLLKVEGIVFGSRADNNEKVYVFLFTKRVDGEIQSRIRKYIQINLQSKMDEGLK